MSLAANRLAKNLRHELGRDPNQTDAFRWGLVAGISNAPPSVDVRIEGSATVTPGLKYLGSYSPKLNDVVVLGRGQGQMQTSYFVLGSLSPAGLPAGTLAVTDGTTTVTAVDSIDFTSGAVVTSTGPGIADIAIAAGVTVTDGTTSVPAVTEVDFTFGATVTSGGAGIADVHISSGSPHVPELVVAANNSTTADKTAADYLCTGTNDQTTIAAAIAALNISPFGRILLCAGTYSLTAPIGAIDNGQELIGMGIGTQLHIESSYVHGGNPLIRVGSASVLRDIFFQGAPSTAALSDPALVQMLAFGGSPLVEACVFNGTLCSAMIEIKATSSGRVIHNFFDSTIGWSVYIWQRFGGTACASNIVLANTINSESSAGGIYCGGFENVIADNALVGVQAATGRNVGIMIEGTTSFSNGGGSNVVTGNVIDIYGVATPNAAIMLSDHAYGNLISGNWSQDAVYGVLLSGSHVERNQISGHVSQDSTAAYLTGSASYNNLQGVMLSTGFSGQPGIQVDSGCTGNVVTNCDLRGRPGVGTLGLVDSGTGTITAPGNQM